MSYFYVVSYLFEPEGNACSLTDSTAEEHVLALVEHSADEARDRINRYMPSSKVIKKYRRLQICSTVFLKNISVVVVVVERVMHSVLSDWLFTKRCRWVSSILSC